MSKIYGVIPNDPVPDAPAAPVPDEVTAGYVSLSWDPVDRATLYQLYRDGSPLGGPTANTYATDSAVVPSTAYSYQLQAFNASGGSALSDALPVTTSANSLPEWGLTDQSGTIGAEFSLGLNTVCGDVDGHARTYTLVSGSVPGLSLTSPNYSGTPTTAGAYPLTFRASDGYGTSDVSITLNVYDPDVTAPTVPANVSASANGSTVTVTWDASTDATGVAEYKIYRGGQYHATDAASPYEETGVPNGSYSYTVSAVDSSANANESAQSSAAPVTVSVAPQTPDTPISFTATAVSPTQINLSWADGPNGPVPDDYDLDWSLTGTGGWNAIAFVGTATTYPHTGRTSGTTYYYRVRANKTGVASGYATAFAVASSTASVISNYAGGPAWPSGIGQASAQIDAWETWVGRSPGTMDVVTAFSSSKPLNWTSYRDGKAGAGSNFTIALSKAPRTRTIIHVYPMFAKFNNTLAAGDNSGTNLSNENNARPQTFAEIAAGNYDAHYTACATAMRQLIINAGRDINDNNGNVIINLAHEMNGDWYDHFVGSATANWVLAWRRIVTLFRAVMPGLRFEWRPARNDRTAAYNGGVRTNPTAYFPGSAYVDFVGRSLHDNYASVDGVSHSTIDENSWQKIHVAPTDRVWAVGLTEMLAIATTNGKKFGLSEWGAQMTAIAGHPVGEASSVFIQKCYEWMYANRAYLAWDTYFSSSDASLHGTVSTVDPEAGGASVPRNQTKAALKFKQLWVPGSVPVAYNPGHYAAYELTRNGVDSTFSNANYPGIVGVQMRYTWKSLETSLGVYNFAQVLTDLNNAQAVGKRMIVLIVDKTFDNTVAAPSYLSAYTSPNPAGVTEGTSVHRWRDYPRDRMIALIQAMAASIGTHPALEAVATQETSIGISDTNLTTYGYTHQLYRDAYKSVLSAACTAFPTKRIFWYMNFIASTPGLGGGQAMIGEVIDYMIAQGHSNFSFGGPDILPNNTPLNNLTYPYYGTYNGQVRMFCSNQFDSYESVKSTSPTVYHTMDEMLDWGATNLHINYCLWNYQATAAPVGSNDWADALVAIAASPTFGPT